MVKKKQGYHSGYSAQKGGKDGKENSSNQTIVILKLGQVCIITFLQFWDQKMFLD